MADFRNQRADPATGSKPKQPIAGSPKKKVAPTRHRCAVCGSAAKADKKYCRSCASKGKAEQKALRAQKKAAEEKANAKKWGKSETSTISVRGVRKNKWRSTYDGPRFLREDYLLENRGEENEENTLPTTSTDD